MQAKKSTSNLLDSVIIVDEHDHPIGTMDKYEAHRHGATLHRAISIYIFRNSGSKLEPKWEVLLQKRSPQKIVGGDMWANTACGNVRPGESYRECAYRRLREELGFSHEVIESVGLEAVYKFMYAVRCNEEFSEREIDQVFVGVVRDRVDLDFSPNPNEVIETKWVLFEEILDVARKENWLPNTSAPIVWNENVNDKAMTIAPWFVWMLRDEELMGTIFSVVQEKSGSGV